MNAFSILRAALVPLLLAFALPAFASNLRFMKDSPLQQFTPQDMAIFKKALADMLDTGKDGDDSKWSNPATEASGELKAIKSFDRSGTPCRTLMISNSANGLSASGRYNFCKPASTGKWALAN
jgi:17 kDa outer membrane surface antigen